MNILVDTCAFIWLITEPERLSEKARKAFEDKTNSRFFSMVSLWETMLVHEKKKNVFTRPAQEILAEYIEKHEMNILPLNEETIYSLPNLPPHHKDPFDRMLIRQALNYDLAMLTPDKDFRKYEGVRVVW